MLDWSAGATGEPGRMPSDTNAAPARPAGARAPTPRPAAVRVAGTATLAFAVALSFRLFGPGEREIWVDEARTLFAVSRDWGALIGDRVAAGHSPLYFMALKLLPVPPGDLALFRLASVLTDSAACGLLAATLARFASLRAAAFGALLYAGGPIFILWAQNARPYALLMLCVAIGMHGAAGLIAGAERVSQGRGRFRVADRWMMAAGLSAASATMTLGVLVSVLVAASPLLSPSLRGNRAFGRAWRQCLLVPAISAAIMAAVVSWPHVAEQAGRYWTEGVAPATAGTLGRLASYLVTGNARTAASAAAILGAGSAAVATVLLGAGLVLAAALGAGRAGGRPALLPFAAVAAGLPAILLLASLETSLLVTRYFLPAWMAVAVLAGAGLDGFTAGRPRRLPLALALCLAVGAFGLVQSADRGEPRDPAAGRFARIVATAYPRGVAVHSRSLDPLYNPMRIEVALAVLDLPWTTLVETDPVGDIADRVAAGMPLFIAVSHEEWQAGYRYFLPIPDCQFSEPQGVLAYFGPDGQRVCGDGRAALLPE